MDSDQKIVLQVEDDAEDALYIRYSFEQAGFNCHFHQVISGEEAVDYLSAAGQYANREQFPLPDLVLLDLKLPGKSGFAVLEWIRQQENFRALPVVVVTSSERPDDLRRAYALGATSCLPKAVSCREVMQVLDGLALNRE